ncbi:hypothetical protein SprV_0802567000 [Sparganum proliferum]
MPISYVDDISDGSGAFIFVKILARWKGSLYKLVWVDLAVYITCFYIINFTYRFLLTPPQKQIFEGIVQYCDSMKGNIPVSFLLGFFVSGVIGRWYQMYMYIPWMNNIAYSTMATINTGDSAVSRQIRLSLMRYMNLAWILLMRRISDQIADRFKQAEDDNGETAMCSRCKTARPNKLQRRTCHPWSISQFAEHKSALRSRLMTDRKSATLFTPRSADFHMELFGNDNHHGEFEGEDEWSIRATLEGFNRDKKIRDTFGKIITEEEIRAFEAVAKQFFLRTRQRYLPEYWVPLQWAVRLVQKAGLNGHIAEPRLIGTLLGEIGTVRNNMQLLQVYSSIMMPLVYTQVVIIAVYSFFACQLMASQFIEVPKNSREPVIDFFVPVFSIFYFLFLIGWLKVALCVMNPFGDDDEDFETSAILDYNLDVSYRLVLLEETFFPETLQVPTFEIPPMKGHENDNLKDFLTHVSDDLAEAKIYREDNEITNLEIKPGCCGRLRKDRGRSGPERNEIRQPNGESDHLLVPKLQMPPRRNDENV